MLKINSETHEKIGPALEEFTSGIKSLECFLSCYLTGSYYEGAAVKGASDIDITLVSGSPLGDDKQLKFNALTDHINQTYSVNLDISFVTIKDGQFSGSGITFREAAINAKIAGCLIWGSDTLSQLPVPSHNKYLESTRKIPFEFSNRVRDYSGLRFPLTYPDPKDRYYGYVKEIDGAQSTQVLMSLVLWLSTGVIAHISDIQIGNKKQCVDAMMKVDPERGKKLLVIFNSCRQEWKYLEPKTPEDQEKLRSFCAQALIWENEYYNRFFPEALEFGA